MVNFYLERQRLKSLLQKVFKNLMQLIKGSSAREINLLIKKEGTFWQKASYDRLIRDEKELSNVGDYIMNNPLKAGLVNKREDWPYMYSR